jgi:hypothetical protein
MALVTISSTSSAMNTPRVAAFCLIHTTRGRGSLMLAQSVFVFGEPGVLEDRSVRPFRDVTVVSRDDDAPSTRRVMVDVMAAPVTQQNESGALQAPQEVSRFGHDQIRNVPRTTR